MPITRADELVEEGRVQENCAASYLHEIVKGSSYLYRVLAPERATLELRRHGAAWGVVQLSAARNRRVRKHTRDAVVRWCEGARDESSDFPVEP